MKVAGATQTCAGGNADTSSSLSLLPEGLQVRPEHCPPIPGIDAHGGRVAHDALGGGCWGRRQVLRGDGTQVGGGGVEQPLPEGLPRVVGQLRLGEAAPAARARRSRGIEPFEALQLRLLDVLGGDRAIRRRPRRGGVEGGEGLQLA